jgi:malate dehydrogenase (quinone)
MVSLLEKVFKDKVATPAWQEKLHQILPSYGTQLNDDPAKVAEEWAYTAKVLELMPPPAISQTATPSADKEEAKPMKEKAPADMAL